MTRCSVQRGFSYLWVLLLVALLGMSVGFAWEIHSTSVRRDREAELLAIGRQFRVAIGRYHEAMPMGRREYPASLEDLLFDKRVSGGRRHLRKVFVDPMTGKPDWVLVRVAGRVVGVHSRSDAVPIKQGAFEAEDAGFAGKQAYHEWKFTYPSDLMQRGAADPALPGASSPVPGLAASAGTPWPGLSASGALGLKP